MKSHAYIPCPAGPTPRILLGARPSESIEVLQRSSTAPLCRRVSPAFVKSFST